MVEQNLIQAVIVANYFIFIINVKNYRNSSTPFSSISKYVFAVKLQIFKISLQGNSAISPKLRTLYQNIVNFLTVPRKQQKSFIYSDGNDRYIL